MPNNSSVIIVSAQTATGAGETHPVKDVYHAFQVEGTTTSGAGSATVLVEVSNRPSPSTTAGSSHWVTLTSFALTITDENTPAVAVYAAAMPYRWVRGRVSAISGTGASINLWMSHGRA